MFTRSAKYYYFLLLLLLLNLASNAQRKKLLLPVSIPSSTSLNVTFGAGNSNIGAALPAGNSEFNFTNNSCPGPGEYSIVNNTTCPGWTPPPFCVPNFNSNFITAAYWDIHLFDPDSNGYMMYVNCTGIVSPKILFTDTVKNLCGGNMYQFFATIFNIVAPSSDICGKYPIFTFKVTTLSGLVLQSYQSVNVDYNSKFSLPAGESTVIVAIIINPFPSGPAYDYCARPKFAIDNIQLLPFGPLPTINVHGRDATNFIAGTCFQATSPLVINSKIDSIYFDHFYPAPPDSKMDTVPMFTNPANQWQKSNDWGYTWNDMPGEINSTLTAFFTTPDTFLIRMRASEAANINNPNCSVVSNIIKVEVNGLPTDYTFTSNSPVCTDSDMIFKLTGGASYIVTGPNGFYDNSNFPHIYSPSLSDTGWYYAQIMSFGGCVAKDSTRVIITGPDLRVSPDTSICYGDAVQLYSSGGYVYSWSPSSGLSDVSIPDPIASPVITTKYKIKTTDQNGCSETKTVTIKLLNGILKADFTGSQYLCRETDSAKFINTSIGKITNYNWDFGNGSIDNSKDPPVQHYNMSNNNFLYTIRLSISDSSGCADTVYRYLHVVDNCYIAVPNAFTPNNDGLNDYLYPLNAYKANDLSFRVYDRFGQLVFETRNWTQKWDGTVKGQEAAAATYVWILTYTNSETGKRVEQKGTTILIR
jgi:gliding motility-associated-like protein